MFEPLLEALRAGISGERALETVRALARFHRIQATPGYDAAAEWVAREARGHGLEVAVEHVPGDGRTRSLSALLPEGWDCERAVLVDADERIVLADWDRSRLALIQRSSPARGRFPVVALADGTEPEHYDRVEVRDHLVLTSGPAMRVHQLAVVERGAAGMLCDGRRLMPPVREDHHDRDSLAYTSFWWAARLGLRGVARARR